MVQISGKHEEAREFAKKHGLAIQSQEATVIKRSFSGISFRYHPDPLKTGAFSRGEVICDCCASPTSIFYSGPAYGELDDIVLCPGCIASGRAAETYNIVFTVPDCCDDIGDPDKLVELCFKTPGYAGIQQEHWLSHCGEYCAYLGQVSHEQMKGNLLSEVAQTWLERPQTWSFNHVLGSLGLQYEGHLFRCLVCGKHLLYVQRD